MKARVFSIQLSSQGMPKLPVPSAEIGPLGLAGDHQRDRRHHGGPERAVCLYSLERILSLQEEGHPIYPGSIGENLTVAGLDWDRVGPGLRLTIGPKVELEVTGYAVPCSTIAASFAGGRVQTVRQEKRPGFSRVYARVAAGGPVAVGDPIRTGAP